MCNGLQPLGTRPVSDLWHIAVESLAASSHQPNEVDIGYSYSGHSTGTIAVSDVIAGQVCTNSATGIIADCLQMGLNTPGNSCTSSHCR
mmetsp:Transcript_55792/g.141243  ORF Transcript_55792/g.141243 Transcript_55792/m.141243 type:complete len:89 (+) Transcript_55792:1764-2030(+)